MQRSGDRKADARREKLGRGSRKEMKKQAKKKGGSEDEEVG